MDTKVENNNRKLLPLAVIFTLILCLAGTLFYILDEQSGLLDDVEDVPVSKLELYNISIKAGDNLTKIFKAVGLDPKDVYLFENLGDKAKPINNLKPKQMLSISVDNDAKRCVNLVLWLSNEEKLEFNWIDNHYDVKLTKQALNYALNYASVKVKTSLLEDAISSGISKNIVYQLTEALGWEVDFIKDLRAGDEFQLLYKQSYLPGKGFVNDDLEELLFITKNNTIRATKFKNSSGLTAFYLPDGSRLSRDFLNKPLKFTRISSPYSTSRKHPLLGITRPHHGVDLAAKYGSPIWSTGDGRVAFVGTKSGYGKTIVIQHNYKYKTIYAHLSKFSPEIKKGAKVKQGQVIGNVGTTGITTGPHLHYEFRINNEPVNPMTVKIPRSQSLANKDMIDFNNLLEKNDEIREQIKHAREE